jgi:hypothetical protein
MAAGVTSTGGVTALVVSRLRSRNDRIKEMDADKSNEGATKEVSP